MNRLRKQIKTLIDEGFKPASSCSIEGWGAAIAIGASAAIGAAGSAYSASQQAKAAKTAAGEQEMAAEDQLSLDSNVFNAQAAMALPTRELGGEAQSREAYLLGLDPNLDISADFSSPSISTSPGSGSTLNWTGALSNTQASGSSIFGGTPTSGSYSGTPATAAGTTSAATAGIASNFATNGLPGATSGTAGSTNTNNAWGGSGNPNGVTNPNQIYGGSGYGSFANPYSPSTFYQDPGYQFELQQGQQAIQNQQASSGLALSPSALAAGLQYTTGLASQEFNQAYNRSLNTQVTQLNELNSLASGGQVATSGLSSDASSLASSGSTALGNYGSAASAGTIGAANATASGIAGVTNSLSSAANYYALGSLSGGGYGGGVNSNPYNLGGSTQVAAPGYQLTRDADGNITGSVPITS